MNYPVQNGHGRRAAVRLPWTVPKRAVLGHFEGVGDLLEPGYGVFPCPRRQAPKVILDGSESKRARGK